MSKKIETKDAETKEQPEKMQKDSKTTTAQKEVAKQPKPKKEIKKPDFPYASFIANIKKHKRLSIGETTKANNVKINVEVAEGKSKIAFYVHETKSGSTTGWNNCTKSSLKVETDEQFKELVKTIPPMKNGNNKK